MNSLPAVSDGGAMTPMVMTPTQLHTIKQTIAADTNTTEFDLFVEVAKRTGLDPFRRQIFPLVFNKNARDQSKRRMSIVVAQDGLRSIAARGNDYRPDEAEPAFEYTEQEIERQELTREAKKITDLAKRKARLDEIAKFYPVDPLNPAGIHKCTVRLFKMDRGGKWHPVNGTAYWSEFAPVKEAWVEGENGKRRPSGKRALDSTSHWPKAPRLMIAKCATMQALRAGWPDHYGGLYAQEEMDKALAEESSATELLDHHRAEIRLSQAGVKAGEIPWISVTAEHPHGLLTFVQKGAYYDTVLREARATKTVAEVKALRARNAEGLKRFWAENKNDALDLRDQLDTIESNLAA